MSTRFLGKAAVLLTLAFASATAFAQYREVNLVSTSSATTPHKDPNLINGWGIAFFPGSPYWISDNVTGKSTLYDQFGDLIPLVVTIPPAPSQPFGPVGTPTGIIANPTAGFVVTENGFPGRQRSFSQPKTERSADGPRLSMEPTPSSQSTIRLRWPFTPVWRTHKRDRMCCSMRPTPSTIESTSTTPTSNGSSHLGIRRLLLGCRYMPSRTSTIRYM